MPKQYNFARYWLKLHTLRLRSSDDRSNIQTFLPELVREAEYPCNLKSGKPTIIVKKDERKEKPREGENISVSYEELTKAGLFIISMRAKIRRFAQQRVVYSLARKFDIPATATVKSQMPYLHRVEYNTQKRCFRIVGSNTGYLGVGEWVK